MTIALLTCQKLPELQVSDQKLIPELAKHNIVATPVIWNDTNVTWQNYDYLIFRNTWDYFELEDEFNTWLAHIQHLGIKTLNPIEVIQKNKHKFYLKELQQNGTTIIPTVFIDKTGTFSLQAILPKSWDKGVLKPAFSAGSYLTEVFDAADVENINKTYGSVATGKDLLLQKFMPEINDLGETSLIFFNKQFSHAVNKKPKHGDFRVQTQYGGHYTLVNPSEKIIETAQNILNKIDNPLLYARVDGIVIKEELYLMEIELIEPDLYFSLYSDAISNYVKALIEITSAQ